MVNPSIHSCRKMSLLFEMKLAIIHPKKLINTTRTTVHRHIRIFS